MIDQEPLGNFIKTLRLTVSNLRIYPPTSQMVMVALDTLYKTVQQLAEQHQSLTVSELSGKLMLNGTAPNTKEVLLASQDILKVMALRHVQSITFRKGITREELSDFITSIIRKKREELAEYPHIALDQTIYVATVKGEETVVKITELVQGSKGDMVGLITSLRESCDLIDQISDPSVREQTQEHLAQELAKQDPATLREIFDRELPPRVEQSGLKQNLLRALSQDKIQEIFGEISGWYEEIRKKESSDFNAIDQLEKLKIFMQTVLQAPAAKEIPRLFFEELLQKGLLSQLPEWFSSTPSKPTVEYEVERLLEKSPVDLLEKQVRDALPGIVEKLCQIEYNELLTKLLEKLLENLRNSVPKIRLPAAQTAAAVYEILQAHGKEQLLRYMELPLLEAARLETVADINYILLEILRLRARQDILYGEYELAQRIIDLFRQHRSPDITPDEKIRFNAERSLANLIPEIIGVLVTDLKTENEKKRPGSLQILARLGENAVAPLINVIKESDDIRNRKLAALALKNLGAPAAKRFNDELNLSLTSSEMQHIIEVLPDLGTEEMIEQLNNLIHYPDTGVKKDILRFLAKINTSQAKVLIIEQLKDADTEVVSEAVRLLRELKCAEAVPALVKLLNSSRVPSALQEEICVTLGAIGKDAAIPALIAKLKKKASWFSRKADDNERVRMRAAWALRKFFGPDVEQALDKASRDKAAPVALAAKESLGLLRQGSKGEGK